MWHGQTSFVHVCLKYEEANMREDDIIKQLVEKLKPLNPEKTPLFGSYALGRPCQAAGRVGIAHPTELYFNV